ncbi:unnamed protein product [Schistosoma margrebowiei]|uniref:Uncharacterized protein n=1 Tax=Schistosoma margrebowiei TaxID=48269 RepID=A0A3P7YPB5_9TREM|nr:unnamed protein product [Schistosoma margrebowiei]
MSGTLHYTSTSLIMKRHFKVWIEGRYGNFFYNTEKIVNIIRNSYGGLQYKVVHGGQLTDALQVRTKVRQGFLHSPFLFLMVVNCIMRTSTSEGKHGIQWTAQNQLDDWTSQMT